MTLVQFAIARFHAQSGLLAPEVARYRESESGLPPRRELLPHLVDDSPVSPPARRNRIRHKRPGAHAEFERRLIQEALKVDPQEAKPRAEEIRISEAEGRRERRMVEQAERSRGAGL